MKSKTEAVATTEGDSGMISCVPQGFGGSSEDIKCPQMTRLEMTWEEGAAT